MRHKYQSKRLVALLTALSISLGLSGCSSLDKSSMRDVSIKKEDLQTSSPLPTLSPEALEALELQKLVDDYLGYFSSIQVSYPNEDLYPSEKKIDKILSKDETYCEYEHQDTMTVDQLFHMIKKNSIQYAKNHPKFRTPFVNSQLRLQDDREFMSSIYFEGALENTLEEIKKESSNDYLEDICRIKNLKIVFGDLYSSPLSSVCGEYDPKCNRIILDPKAIEDMPKKYEWNDETKLYQDVLKHEFFHLRSTSCEHRAKKGQKFKEILGDDSVTSIKESSAESFIYVTDEFGYQDVNSYNFAYSEEREDESLILLLGLFHDNKTYDDYYNAILDSNPEAFYDFCGAKTKEERHNLYKILAAIDGKNCRNDIAFKAKKSDEISQGDAEKKIRYNYKLDIFHKVINNMIDYTSTHPDFTIDKNLEIFSIIENCILDNNYYLNQKNSYDQSFILDIYQSEIKYLDFLAEYYFKGEGKDHSFIQVYYQKDCYDYDEDAITHEDEWWMSEFPLLKPIVFAHDYTTDNHQDFLEKNKKLIKQNGQNH
ncbi:MAG: hypothetical protein HFJ12_05070 [Bacilli bacterium]|nr:hypothetical protein [Bacilli bacterium]